MQRYLVSLAAGLTLSVACVVGLVVAAAGYPPDQNALIMKAKLTRAAEMPAPKTVLIGGSNVRFGISARMIEEATSTPTINLAHTGELGLDYLLFLTRQALKPGDTIIMAFEYDWYNNKQVVNRVNSRAALWNSLAWVFELPLYDKIRWSRNISPLTISGALRERLKPTSLALPVGSFNAWGDQIGHEPTETSRQMLNAEGEVRPFAFEPDGIAAHSVSRFLAWCASNRVTAAATWPVFARDFVDRRTFEPFVEQVRQLYVTGGAVILGEPADALLPPDLLYYSVRHANAHGTRVRTERLIKAIQDMKRSTVTMTPG